MDAAYYVNGDIYGDATVYSMAQVQKSALKREDVLDFDPADYCLPFTLRLSLKLDDLGMLEEGCPDEGELRALISRKAQERGISVRAGWFDGKSDPGEFRDSDSTRMNFYGLCAALDADLRQTGELFRKVFFKSPFLPKRRQELIFWYFAKKARDAGESGSGWYERGLALESRLPRPVAASAPAMVSTRQIYGAIEGLSEEEFERFLKENASAFAEADPRNEFVTARGLIRELAESCWYYLCREHQGEPGYTLPFANQYDSLVDGILGFRQRGKGAAGSLSELDLPRQLLSCFPSGKILGDILGRSGGAKDGDLNAVISLDELSKMAILLLFYLYFRESGGAGTAERFGGFVSIANQALEQQGLDYLYPGQPYGSFMLYHAAAADPVDSLRAYLLSALGRSAELRQAEHIRACAPDCPEKLCRELAKRCSASPFCCRLAAWLLSEGLCRGERLLAALPSGAEDEAVKTALLRVFESLPRPALGPAACVSFLPDGGLSRGLLLRLVPELSRERLERLARAGLVTEKKNGLVTVSAELRGFFKDMELDYDARRQSVLDAAAELAERTESLPEASELASVLEALAPKAASERRAEYFLKAAALYSQSRDERELNRALDCAGRAAKYRLNALGKRERDKAASGAALAECYEELSRVHGLLGNRRAAEEYKAKAAGCDG